MNRIKRYGINYYVILSILIHSLLFLFIKEEKDITFGEKIIPIEIIDNLLEAGYGEATERSKKLVKRNSTTKKAIKKTVEQQKSFVDNKLNKKINKKNFEPKKVKNNPINQPILREKKGSGSRDGLKSNEPEKGSLKGKGKVRITCLKCVRPNYPPIALRRGAEGTPKVKVWINKKGMVFKADLIRQSGNDSIDQAAKKAAINSTFYPIEEEASINIEYELKIR